jgi:hypothetical protein
MRPRQLTADPVLKGLSHHSSRAKSGLMRGNIKRRGALESFKPFNASSILKKWTEMQCFRENGWETATFLLSLLGKALKVYWALGSPKRVWESCLKMCN